MPRVELSDRAVENLDGLIRTHSLPPDTKDRLRRRLQALEQFPLLGAAMAGPWEGFRFVLGPWRWMVVVYVHVQEEDRVVVVTIQDGRSSRSPTSSR